MIKINEDLKAKALTDILLKTISGPESAKLTNLNCWQYGNGERIDIIISQCDGLYEIRVFHKGRISETKRTDLQIALYTIEEYFKDRKRKTDYEGFFRNYEEEDKSILLNGRKISEHDIIFSLIKSQQGKEQA